MTATQSEIMEKAERLASNLVGGSTKVGKNVLLSIVADFMSSPHPDRERLRRTLELIQKGSGGHTKRAGGYGEQVKVAVDEITEALRENLSDDELKSLFGWTARLLLVRRGLLAVKTKTDLRPGKSGSRSPAPAKAEKGPPQRLGPGLGAKSLSTLEQLRQQLQDKEKGKKG